MMHSLSIITKINLVILTVLGLCGGIVTWQVITYEKQHIEEMLVKQAETIFDQIQTLRHWNSGYGGVYVYKQPDMEANPYLYKVRPASNKKRPVEPEITDSRGRKLILKNPELMAMEIAEQSKNEHKTIFHLSSLSPINPKNAPDDFERRALRAFEAGNSKVFKSFLNGGNPYFRYMRALKSEESCLTCHGFQGHKLGDVRGGISIEIPMQEELAHAEGKQVVIIAYAIAIYLVVALALTVTIRRLVSTPVNRIIAFSKGLESEDDELLPENGRNDEIGILGHSLATTKKRILRQQLALREKAEELDLSRRTDPLTGANNLQHFILEMPRIMDRANRDNSPTSVLMVDIDHFKEINDSYGHAIGDRVLQQMVEHMLQETRSYDMLVRYGGEEFLVVMPNTETHSAVEVAERIRKSMESCHCVVAGDKTVLYTVSIGVYTSMQEEIDQMLLKVDDAMYRAKEGGRNRVVNTA